MPYVYRSARSGRFVKAKFAKRHPNTTMREKVGPVKWVKAKLTTAPQVELGDGK